MPAEARELSQRKEIQAHQHHAQAAAQAQMQKRAASLPNRQEAAVQGHECRSEDKDINRHERRTRPQ